MTFFIYNRAYPFLKEETARACNLSEIIKSQHVISQTKTGFRWNEATSWFFKKSIIRF
jgi:hypothetical protein